MKRVPLRAVSSRRISRDAAYPSSRRAIYDRADGMCEAMCNDRCQRYGHQVHHLAGRSGPDPHRLDNLLLCCRPCHDHIHANPALSYDRGWMVRRNGTADA